MRRWLGRVVLTLSLALLAVTLALWARSYHVRTRVWRTRWVTDGVTLSEHYLTIQCARGGLVAHCVAQQRRWDLAPADPATEKFRGDGVTLWHVHEDRPDRREAVPSPPTTLGFFLRRD